MEPRHDPLSLPRGGIHAFYAALRDNTEPGPVPTFPDNGIYCELRDTQFRLTFFATGVARHFSLVGRFVENDERIYLDWNMETALPALWMTLGGGFVAVLVFLIGLTSKDGPQWFTLLWSGIFGAISYGNYRTMGLAKDDTQKLLLETVQTCIDEAGAALSQSAPIQLNPAPTEPTP